MAGSIKNFLSKFSSKSNDEEDRFINSTSVTLREDKHSCNPNKAWACRKKSQTFKTLTPTDPSIPRKKGCVRFVCISDTHTILEKQGKDGLSIPEGDVLLHAGDFTMYGTPDEVAMVNEYLGSLPHKYKIVVAGNHDVTFDLELIDPVRSTRVWKLNEDNFERRLKHYRVKTVHEMLTNCIYLQDSMVKVHGLNIYGTPWQPGGGNWGFNCRRGMNLLEKWNKIPETTDILLTHCPPCGHGDNVNQSILKKVFDPRGSNSSHHVGCVDLLNTIQNRVKPKYHVFGHIHEGYGITSDGTTTFINAAICDEHYRARNEPFVFDVPLCKKSKYIEKPETEFEWVIPTELPDMDTLSDSSDTDDDDYCSSESDDDIQQGQQKSDTKFKTAKIRNNEEEDYIVFCDEICEEDQSNLNCDDEVVKNATKRNIKTKETLDDTDDDFIVFSNEICEEDQSKLNCNDEEGKTVTKRNVNTKETLNDTDDDDFIVFSNEICDELKTTLSSDEYSDDASDENSDSFKNAGNKNFDDNDDFIVFCNEKSDNVQMNSNCDVAR